MKMLNCENATVNNSKVDNYLLDENHEQGGSKAKFFKLFGFTDKDSSVLKKSLLEHARERNVDSIQDNNHGRKYILECELNSPDKRNPCVRSIWIIKKGESIPKFITAIPFKVK